MSQAQISTDETSSSTNHMVGIKEKPKLDRSASNARKRCLSGTPGEAREVPTEHFQKKDPSKSTWVNFFLMGGVL